jgi:hypothetical protein
VVYLGSVFDTVSFEEPASTRTATTVSSAIAKAWGRNLNLSKQRLMKAVDHVLISSAEAKRGLPELSRGARRQARVALPLTAPIRSNTVSLY